MHNRGNERISFFLAALAGLIALVLPHAARASLLVYNTNDSGAGSLRQAVTDNHGLGGGNTIVFSNTVSGTITLAIGELMLDKNVTITGPGPGVVTLSGNPGAGVAATRIFEVSNSTASISGLTLINGTGKGGGQDFNGGGILNWGNLVLSNCVISNCVSLNGSAIANHGTNKIINCTFENNNSSKAIGALVNYSGTSILTGSSLVNNIGGAVHSAGGLQILTNCTLANDRSGYGLFGSGFTVMNCTITGNALGGWNGSGVVGSTIIAGNSTNQDTSGAFTSSGYNLIGWTTGSTGFNNVGDQVGSSLSPLDPHLLPLGFYGGLTLVMPPASVAPSLVIDQGKALGSTFDQRGRSRTVDFGSYPNAAAGDGTDIGAVELSLPLVYEWNFDRSNLLAVLGPGPMTYSDAATPGLVGFGQTTGTTISNIAGISAHYMHVPTLTGLSNGFWLTLTGSEPNGGGQYLNQYTFVIDLLIPQSGNWAALFNTNPQNQNDADFYIGPDGSIGINNYSSPGLISANTWYRLAFVADLKATNLTYYLNGATVGQNNTATLDGRWSVLSDPNSPALLLFNEGDPSGVYTHELYFAHVAFAERAMSAAEIAALGGPASEGIFFRRLNVTRSGNSNNFTWRGASNVVLQKTTNLLGNSWVSLPSTLGSANYTEKMTNAAFYRVMAP